MICRVWAFCLIYHLSWFFSTGTKHNENTNLTTCTYNYNRELYIYFYITDFILFYVSTLLSSGYMYIRIYQKLYKSSKFSNLVTVRLNNCSDENNLHMNANNYSTITSKNLKSDDGSCTSKNRTRNELDNDSFLNQNSDLNDFNRKKSLSQSSFSTLNHKNSFNYHQDFTLSNSNRSSLKNSLSSKSQFNSSIKYYKNSKTQLELGDEINRMHNDEFKRRENKVTKSIRSNKKDSVALSSKSQKNKGTRLRELTKVSFVKILCIKIYFFFIKSFQVLYKFTIY